MSLTDPVSDMLCRLRNAYHARHDSVVTPFSGVIEGILEVLRKEKYIKQYETVTNGKKKDIVISLRYSREGKTPFNKIIRISKPGYRRYMKSSQLKPKKAGTGILILSTPNGIYTDREAREKKLGGEVLCSVW